RSVIQDSSAAAWGFSGWERFLQDLRLGARMLRKTPGFTAVAAATLALGLGMNTAVFSVVNAVMLRSLPYPEPDRVVSLWEESRGRGPARSTTSGTSLAGKPAPQRSTVSVANLADYREQARAFTSLASCSLTPKNLTGSGEPERIMGESVS